MLFVAIPDLAIGQTDEGEDKFNIVLSCTEFIGDGKMLAHFGYDNPNRKTIVLEESGSVVTYNYGQSKKYAINTFEPGVHEKAFSQVYNVNDRVEWTVVFPDGSEKTTDANINSNHCTNPWESLNIIPGYYPPEGGKQYESKIGAELTSLYNYYISTNKFKGVTDDVFQIEDTRVLIEVVAEENQYGSMINELEALGNPGFDVVTEDLLLNRATGWVEIGDLLNLNEMIPLHYARPVYPGVGNYIVPATGLTNSQGDFAMHADFARLGYDINGEGVKIGVLSNSYDTRGEAARDVRNGDLPGPENINGYLTEVHVLQDITNGTLSDEGRAMLQIIHDIAPGAELAFRTGFLGEQDMAQGIKDLADPDIGNCDIIVDDLSYITEPFFRDGVISKAIEQVVGDGVAFFSSAGNFGSASYEADFYAYIPPVGEDTPGTIPGTAHAFDGTGDIFQKVRLPEGNYTLVMQWDDGSDATMNTTDTDLDIFLSDDAGFSLLGFNRENVGGFPIEVVPFSISGADVEANIVVAKAPGSIGDPAKIHFKYILFRGGSQFEWIDKYDGVESSTIVGHPNAEGAITVGAVRFDKNPVYSDPQLYPDPVIMSFSSIGGTPLFPLQDFPEVRDKPDITAPNGVNTTIDLGNGDWDTSKDNIDVDPDTKYPNFFGTSAASPHAAGMAALIIQAQSKFGPYAEDVWNVKPEGIRALMKSTTIEKYNGGSYNHTHGSGFIQAHKALMPFANPTPYIQRLILSAENNGPGEAVSFTVQGDFFTEQTQILIRDVPVAEEGIDFIDPSTIEVTHPGFLGNPEIKAFTPIISPSGEDGGESNAVYFSDPVKLDVVITALSYDKKYGEVIPTYAATIEVKTIDVFGNETILTPSEAVAAGIMSQAESDRLGGLFFAVDAQSTSDAGQYIIVPSLSPELGTDPSLTEVDNAISEKYILEFVNGSLTIEKLALKITPNDVDMIYGGTLSAAMDFSYELEYGANITEADAASIIALAESEHTTALTNEIALVRGVALVNGIPMIRGVALVNGVTMVRGVALVNGIEVEVKVDEATQTTTVYVAGEPVASGTPLIRGVALVNDLPFVSMTEMVRGVALVNGTEVYFAGDKMSLDDYPDPDVVTSGIPVVRGVALVNEPGIRGLALVNTEDGQIKVEVDEQTGVTYIDENEVIDDGTLSMVNGIPVLRGTALVNSSAISRGVALVNEVGVIVENGIPTARGLALVNGSPGTNVRGIALVNGVPLITGTALVNNLEVYVEEGEVKNVWENGVELTNGLEMSRGVALVNEVALVNGEQLNIRGTALVNGIALTDDEGNGDELVNLNNMNLLASSEAITNGISTVRGVALVNGIEGMDGEALKIATGTELEDGTIIYENASLTSRGLALVNGGAYIRGTALVNTDLGAVPLTSGTPIVNGSAVEDSFGGTILVFDATNVGDPAESVSFTPISFITGTTAGKHWIVPGTYISNNFEISYGLGTLTIDPAPLSITADAKSKTYGEDDPELTYQDVGLVGDDMISGALNREEGEDVGAYAIKQGSLTAGDNYAVNYTPAYLTIDKVSITITAEDKTKTYGQADPALTYTVSGLLGDDAVTGSLTRVPGEQVLEGGYEIMQGTLTAGENYGIIFTSGELTIEKAPLHITAVANSKTYGAVDPELDFTLGTNDLKWEDETADALSGSLSRVPGEQVIYGGYDILQDGLFVGPNYYIETFTSAKFTILQAQLILTAAINGKDYGAADPVLTIQSYTLDGIANAPNFDGKLENVILYFGDQLSGSLSYTGEEVGTHEIILGSLTAGSNYHITVTGGSLFYINPSGPGTRAVKPVLNCIRMVEEGIYEANFSYSNENATPVYIPVGPDNLIEGSGVDPVLLEGLQPVVFEPGGPLEEITIIFDGGQLSWTISSRDDEKKASNAANANSNSTKCNDNTTKSAKVSTAFAEEDPMGTEDLMVYPNPVTSKVNLVMKEIEQYEMLMLYDMTGRAQAINSIKKRADLLEIDMTHLASGTYFIRVVMEDSSSVIQLIKQ